MRRHAKASTAGSTQRQAGRLGRFFRGAFATRGDLPDAKGSSAPSARRFALPLSAFAAILAALVFVVALASAAPPAASTEPASNVEETTATLNGSVNPEGALLEECEFQYGTTASYGQTKACDLTPAEIGEGTSPVAVKADLTGLTPATTFHFRVVAKNSEGFAEGADDTFRTSGPPTLVSWAEGVVRTEATLKAQINPNGLATTYKLEWGPTASYGNSTADSNVGADKANHTVSKALTGLTPGATYHYRFVATNSAGIENGLDHTFTTYSPVALDTGCANQAFRAGAAAQLPDCRGYEMVSPVDKNNGDIAWRDEISTRASALNQSSLTGDKITYTSYKPFGDAIGAPIESQYISTRGNAGWTTHAINPLEKGGIVGIPATEDQEYKAFSPDLSIGWLAPESGLPLAPGAAKGFINFYKRDNLTESYEALTIGPRTSTNPFLGLNMGFQGYSQDGSKAIFTINDKLTADAPYLGEGKTQLYEWVNGNLHLVSILPDGTPLNEESFAGWASGASPLRGREDRVTNAISDDGSRIFWSAVGNSALYVRENPDQPQSALNGADECTEPAKACTTLIAKASGFNSGEPLYWTASGDGSRAIYTLREGGNDYGALYEYDVETKTSNLIAHEVYGVAGASDDATYTYFVSLADLDAGATAGERNLYLHHAGGISFIATLSFEDSSFPGPVAKKPGDRNSRVTPNGRHIVFMSNRDLTGYDNTDVGLGKAVSEVYRYGADSGQLSCISCNPSGGRPSGAREMPFGPFRTYPLDVAAWIPTWTNQLYASRVISDPGSRVFFNSFDALVPQDTNGAQDVYEWEEPGTGSCDEGDSSFSNRNDGCVTLLSSGESPDETEFVDASPSGDNAFIRTKSSLAPQDPGLFDIYDVRVNGGFTQPTSPPSCVGDACQSPSEAPRDPTPASASFRGAGNPVPRKARRRNCRARGRHGQSQAKRKHTKRCKRANRRAGR